MSPPLNSLLTMPATGIASHTSASADTDKVMVVAARTTKGRLLVTLTSLTTFALLSATATTAKADDFELAMVIKETTNPYYNATLEGARIAAKEIGGTANNYGPTQSSGQAQVELINNLADRHIRAIAIAPSENYGRKGKGRYRIRSTHGRESECLDQILPGRNQEV